MLVPLPVAASSAILLNFHLSPYFQVQPSPGTSLILIGALLLVLIILGGILWVSIRRK